MIENQSDKIDSKEKDISDQDISPEDALSTEDLIIENDEPFLYIYSTTGILTIYKLTSSLIHLSILLCYQY